MRKISFILALLILCCMHTNAQVIEGKRYRAFIDLKYLAYSASEGLDAMGVAFSTSHGYQINSNFYVGAGIALNILPMSHGADEMFIPIFGNFRYDFCKGKITPFLDAKIGYSVGTTNDELTLVVPNEYITGLFAEQSNMGAYVSPSIGVRFAAKGGTGFCLQAGYTMQGFSQRYSIPGFAEIQDNGYLHGFHISIGVDL